MATRYTQEKKMEVVKFIRNYDREHGRGGQAAAKKKFQINPISIKKWCVELQHVTFETEEESSQKDDEQNQPSKAAGTLKPGRGKK